MMKKYAMSVGNGFFLLLTFLIVTSIDFAFAQKVDFTSHWDTVRALKNPYKGWCHHLIDNCGIKRGRYAIRNDSVFYSFPGMDHIYIRMAWSYIEPQEGVFNWSVIDSIASKYVLKGYKISFRITCSETGTYPLSVGDQVDGVAYATPGWVEKAGAKGDITIVPKSLYKVWVPRWGDPVFLEKLNQFHKAFAARYDGQLWVSYIDIGSIGDWGEGHTSSTTKIPATPAEVKANVDVFVNNYKKSQLAVCDELLRDGKPENEVGKLYQYVTGKGITLRDDSPLVNWYIQEYSATWSVSHPQFYNPLYLKRPTILETDHYISVKNDGNWLGKNGETTIPGRTYSGADILRGAIKTIHPTYIGYHGFAEDWLADNPDLAGELANLCGYWYFPVKAEIPGKIVQGHNTISLEWLNNGVAPAYKVFSLILRFEAVDQVNSFDVLIEDSGNLKWLPGKSILEEYHFSVPPKTRKGLYNLSFKLVDKTNDVEHTIQLGLDERLSVNQGFVYLDRVDL